jgi:Tfp pilus assembly protein PilX
MIMLILISLLAVASFRLGKSDLQIVGNMQQRKQALSAAQQTIEQVISSTQFTATPTNALFNPCVVGQNTACIDVNGDGVTDINVGIVVLCNAIQPILNSALNFGNPNDAGCLLGNGQNTGVAGAANGNSLCSSSVWDVQATAKDQLTSAQYVVDQGVAVRVPAATICP